MLLWIIFIYVPWKLLCGKTNINLKIEANCNTRSKINKKMIIALYIINVRKEFQSRRLPESSGTVMLSFSLHYIWVTFSHKTFPSLAQFLFFLSCIKKWSHLTWKHDILQMYKLQSCFFCCFFFLSLAVFDLHHHTAAPTQEPWLMVTVIWPWAAVVVMRIQASRWLSLFLYSGGSSTMSHITPPLMRLYNVRPFKHTVISDEACCGESWPNLTSSYVFKIIKNTDKTLLYHFLFMVCPM